MVSYKVCIVGLLSYYSRMNQSDSQHQRSYTIRRLMALLKPYRTTFIFAMLALLSGSAVNLLLPEIIRQFLNETAAAFISEHVWSVAFILIAVFAVQALSFYVRSYLFGIVGQKVVADLRKDLFNAIITQEVEFFDTRRTGDLVSRLNSDTLLVQDAVSIKLSVLIRYTIQVIVGLVLMSFISWKLTVTLGFILPVIVAISIGLGRKLKRYSRLQSEQLGQATAISEESLSSIRIVKAFNAESTEAHRYTVAIHKVLNFGIKRSKIAAFLASFVSFLLNACIVGVLGFGVQLVLEGSLNIGDLTAFLLYGAIVAVSFALVAGGYTELLQSLGAAERVFELIDRNQPTSSDTKAGKTVASLGQVEFRNVSFAYPARPEIPVLKNISFTARAGKVTALVGPSGAGKSTIVSLVLRLYKQNSGKVLFDGTDAELISVQSLRDHSALVPQDPQLFGVTIADNLRYGKPGATLQELHAACQSANILDFIDALPEKFETNVGERGIQLSQGQRQRISIARALLRNPALLILDEATSALDSENEFLVQEALKLLMHGRTTIVIAHRLSTIKNADTVLVLDQGEIVQDGTHESLSNSTGLYRTLVERQELFDPKLETSNIPAN